MSAVVIIGASHAGVQAAASLRQRGWQERIVLLSAEEDYPYHRPPLSKAYLAGEKAEEQLLLRAPEFYRDQGIDLRLNEPARSIDPHARQVTVSAGRLDYNKLVLATGSRARTLPLPGADAHGIHTLRSISDARVLRSALRDAENIVIIGGGFIGLEFASTAIKQGKSVVVLEAQERLLARALPETLSAFIRSYHAGNGVAFRFGALPERFVTRGDKVSGVLLSDGTALPADLVLVGVGGVAETALAEPLGLKTVAGGIEVDAHGRTSAPDIYALGDVAAVHNAYASAPIRLESVQNAVEQAKAAAEHILGSAAPPSAVPWFWTDQYDLKMQMAGLPRPGTTELLRGDPASGAFSILQLAGSRLVAAYSVNRAADHMASRKLIASGDFIDTDRASDIETPLLKTVAVAAAS